MYNRLHQFFEKHNIFYKYQFGFRQNHATLHALTEEMDYIFIGSRKLCIWYIH